MDGNEIIHKLIVGSEAIDRMRKEIDLVVRMILGFSHGVAWKDELVRFEGKDGFWEIRYKQRSMQNLKAECWIVSVTAVMELAYDTQDFRFAQVPLRFVKAVYGMLPLFVEGMAKECPQLDKSWQPLLDAADHS